MVSGGSDQTARLLRDLDAKTNELAEARGELKKVTQAFLELDGSWDEALKIITDEKEKNEVCSGSFSETSNNSELFLFFPYVFVCKIKLKLLIVPTVFSSQHF